MPANASHPPTAVAFSSNKTMMVPGSALSQAYDFDPVLKIAVLGGQSGTVSFSSDLHEFELENPLDGQVIQLIQITDVNGIVITLSKQHVQVWDVLREIDGMRVNCIHTVATASKPTSMYYNKTDHNCYIGLENGKLVVMDVSVCAVSSPIPRFASSPFADVGAGISCIYSIDGQNLLVGTVDGMIRTVKLESRKIFEKLKSPRNNAGQVSYISPIPGKPSSYIVSYSTNIISLVAEGTIVKVIDSLPSPPKACFSLSVTDSNASPILVQLVNNDLLRLDGPNWSHSSYVLPTGTSCLCLRPGSNQDSFQTTEHSSSITAIREYRIQNGLNIFEEIKSSAVGSFSLSSFGRQPVNSICFPRSDTELAPSLIRLCTSLTGSDSSSTDRFVFEYQDGLWEGVIFSVFNSPCEIAITIFTQSSALVLQRIPVILPDLAVVSSFTATALGVDRWGMVLGLSSGQVGLLDSSFEYPSSKIIWKPIWILEAPESVHSGARVVSVDRSLMDGSLVISVDVNGMVCFTRIDEPSTAKLTRSLTPSHVAIAGDSGYCYTDAKNSCCYVCMSDGTIERIKAPRLKKDGSEDLYDTSLWEAVPLTDETSIPLNGKFLGAYPSEGIIVRESGFLLVEFPSLKRSTGSIEIKKVVQLKSDFGNRIIQSKIGKIDGVDYLVILTDTGSVASFDCRDGFCVFQRTIVPFSVNSTILLDSMHVFEFGVQITSLLFSDRAKLLNSTERIIRSAQRRYKFPPIKSTPLLVAETPAPVVELSAKEAKKKKKEEELANKYKPTERHLQEAREQLAKNLEKMAKLQDDADEMQEESANFLKLATDLNNGFSEKKKKKKFLGLF